MRKKSNVTSEKSQEEKIIKREERLEENLEEKRELKEKHEIAQTQEDFAVCFSAYVLRSIAASV